MLADTCGVEHSWASSCQGSCKHSHFTAPSQHPLPARDSSTTEEPSSAHADTVLPRIPLGVSSQHMKGTCTAEQACQK